jgi:hypothetical protein
VSCWQLLNKQNTAEKTSLSEMNADGGTGAGGSSAPELAGAKLAAPSTVVGPRESGRVNSKQEIDNSRQAALAKAREMACSMSKTRPYLFIREWIHAVEAHCLHMDLKRSF